MLQQICDIIILIGAAAVAIVNICSLIGKPLKIIERKKQNEMKPLMEELKKIQTQNDSQSKQIEALTCSTKDLLRTSIMELYKTHKQCRQLTEEEREYLDDLYNDYTAEGGNSFIKKLYLRMCKWDIIVDDEN